jgi:hypothetical protein
MKGLYLSGLFKLKQERFNLEDVGHLTPSGRHHEGYATNSPEQLPFRFQTR